MSGNADTRTNDIAKRSFARVFVENVVNSELPVFGGALTAMARIVFPEGDDFQMAVWRAEPPICPDDLVAQVVERIDCSELALRIAARISRRLDVGLPEPVSFEEISDAYAGTTVAEVLNACGELEHAGLVLLNRGINDSGQVQAQRRLFETIDPVVYGANPVVDAAEIARHVVSLPANQVYPSHEIVAAYGWNMRRINPALVIIGEMIGRGRVSRLLEESCYLTHLAPNLSERVELRRFADRTLGPSL